MESRLALSFAVLLLYPQPGVYRVHHHTCLVCCVESGIAGHVAFPLALPRLTWISHVSPTGCISPCGVCHSALFTAEVVVYCFM